MLPGVSKAFEALNVSTYFLRDSWSSIGLFRGVHTGSPTNNRIACRCTATVRISKLTGVFKTKKHIRCMAKYYRSAQLFAVA